MRLIITNTKEDLFCQGEWVDNAGPHTRRLTEDMPADIRQKALDVITWADQQEKAQFAPLAENMAERARLEDEIGKLTRRLNTLKAR